MNYIKPNWPAPKTIKAYTTVRSGWGERLAHHDINKGNFTQNNVDYRNEGSQLISLLNLPDEPIWLHQSHTTKVVKAQPEYRETNADASYTDETKRVCVVLTADCLPILICNKQATHVAAIHAGWRGLAGGIVENTLNRLELAPEDLLVWLGPAIGPTKFEVGADVFEAFIAQDPEASIAFKPYASGKWLANLYTLAKLRLAQAKVTQVFCDNYCTHSQPELFFSYRRDQKKTGRMATLIWIDQC